jgi:hypothetical protein
MFEIGTSARAARYLKEGTLALIYLLVLTNLRASVRLSHQNHRIRQVSLIMSV